MSSCAPVVTPPPVTSVPEPTVEFERPDVPLQARLHDAQQAIQTLEYEAAEQLLASLLNSTLFNTSTDASLKFQVVEQYARLLASRDITRALDAVSSFRYVDQKLIVPVNLLRWELCVQGSQYEEALSILIELGTRRFLAKQESNELIWQTLLVFGGVHAIDWDRDHDSNLVAWGELARLHRSHFSGSSVLAAVNEWRRKYPRHDVVSDPPSSFSSLTQAPGSSANVRNVAVFLPTRGSLGEAASAIRDGLLFAYMNDRPGPEQDSPFDVSFYDIDQANPVDLVQGAFKRGADLVIGFIDKDHVAEILDHGSFSGPVVLLNRVNFRIDANDNEVFQFSLSIDDEIDAIVSKLESQGHKRIVLFSGTQPWAIRARNRFLVNFENDHQVVVAQQVFLEPTEIIDAVGQGLDITASQTRRAELERLTRTSYEFVPRRRLDVDAIVAFVDPTEFESMLAALNYHYASDVPLFVTETAVRAGSTSDFESPVYFTSTPWLVEDTPVKNSVGNLFNPPPGTESLYAFGIDTYRIASNWLHFNEIGWLIGSSGTFQLQPNGTMVRSPVWGELNNRVFQVVNRAATRSSSNTYLNLPIVVR